MPGTVELAREVMDAVSHQDAERLVALADPDVEWHSFFAIGEDGAYRGHEGTRRYARDLVDAFEVVLAEIEDTFAVGDIALLVGRIHYRGKGSGVESEAPVLWVLRFRAGKVVFFRAFRNPEDALAGLAQGAYPQA